MGNEVELNQLFQNLISNGIKFQNSSQVPEVDILYSSIPGFHKFVVKDNGIGIPKKHQDRIFAVFQRLHNTTDYPGTGIGLATCKKIVNLHKGELKVVSKEGKGSEFHIVLPKKFRNG
ncbi:MAG: chemotaxis family two-component system sensor kinase Cph1 [Sphingobacteriales bacterium]|jgi:chemotaxis family two-component system sensor kinase Cph1